jgi:hypothetical protein
MFLVLAFKFPFKVAEVQTEAPRPLKVAFISTPSLFFSLTAEERQGKLEAMM